MSTTTFPRRPGSLVDDDGPPDEPRHDGLDDAELVENAIGGAPPTIENGAIADARRHARKRRSRLVVILVVSAVAVAGGFAGILSGQSADPVGLAGDEPPLPPAVNAPTAAVIGRWAMIHSGWVYVYDDGRVLSYPDRGPILVRRLSAYGIDLVREGVIVPEMLLHRGGTIPTGAWSDSTATAYRPMTYAFCNLSDRPDPVLDVLTDIGSVAERLPGSVRTILDHGRIQSFTDPVLDDHGDFVGIDGHHGEPGAGVYCAVLSSDQARAAWALRRPSDDDVPFQVSDYAFAGFQGTDGSEVVLFSIPVMPHGGWVLWGG